MIAETSYPAQHQRSGAVKAQTGRSDQKTQYPEKLCGIIDVVKPKLLEQRELEQAELRNVIRIRFVLP